MSVKTENKTVRRMVDMRVENWRLVSLNSSDQITGLAVENQKISVLSMCAHMAVAGYMSGRNEVIKDGTFVWTSAIKRINREKGYVRTYTGLYIELGQKHQDYLMYEKAMNDAKKLVLGEWKVIKKGWEVILHGRNMNTGELYEGVVDKQNIAKHEITFKDGMVAFVDWSRIGAEQTLYYMLYPEVRQITQFMDFCDLKQEPVLKK